jgi:DNA-binding transcriptional LysR family regulator
VQIDFLGIQAFLAVVETGSFARRPRSLHLSQTAISHRMRKLEESLGVALVVRTSRGIALTEAGNALLPRARSAVQQLEFSFDDVRRHGQDATRWVAFGCVPTVSLEHAGAAAAARGRALSAGAGAAIRQLAGGSGGTGAGRHGRLRHHPRAGRARKALGAAHRARAFRAGLPAPTTRSRCGAAVAWAELLAQPMIRISLPSGNSMTIDDALGPLREQVHWRYEAQRTAMAVEMVRGGLGLTVVPRLCVRAGDGVAAVPIEGPEITRLLVVATRPGVPLRAEESFLADTAAALVREHLAAGARPMMIRRGHECRACPRQTIQLCAGQPRP